MIIYLVYKATPCQILTRGGSFCFIFFFDFSPYVLDILWLLIKLLVYSTGDKFLDKRALGDKALIKGGYPPDSR